jgi:hypothetical protein
MQSIDDVITIFEKHGAVSILAKKLSPNDNSKNQVYLGGDFTVLQQLPHDDIVYDSTSVADSKRERAKASIKLLWLTENGKFAAPNAQLILYPKYPEVRMSGFLKGCKNPPSSVMTVRDEGRVLIFGITANREILAYAAAQGSNIANEINSRSDLQLRGIFVELPFAKSGKSSKQILIERLTAIHGKGWIASQKMSADGSIKCYRASNGGGYTLEAELGIIPNGYSEPDFMGWEIKQYGVTDFSKYRPKSPVTLMTPEPTSGFYRDAGLEQFMRRYGYKDKSGKADRINFGGIYKTGKAHHSDTGLALELSGYDREKEIITDVNGGILLIDKGGEIAAKWDLTAIIDHWNRKHAQAAYLPSIKRLPIPEYMYGPKLLLCENTSFVHLLNALYDGVVYYDPGIKIEINKDGIPKSKRRSQFRIKHSDLGSMYSKSYIEMLS